MKMVRGYDKNQRPSLPDGWKWLQISEEGPIGLLFMQHCHEKKLWPSCLSCRMFLRYKSIDSMLIFTAKSRLSDFNPTRIIGISSKQTARERNTDLMMRSEDGFLGWNMASIEVPTGYKVSYQNQHFTVIGGSSELCLGLGTVSWYYHRLRSLDIITSNVYPAKPIPDSQVWPKGRV